MPDPFFVSASKGQKRKRAPTSSSGARATDSSSSRAPKKFKHSQEQKTSGPGPATKKKRVDEELGSDDGSRDGVDIDDLDLTRSDEDEGASGDEDEHETPAEKRLRLAKLYLESVRKDIGEGDIDAAEVDKEILSARLRQDVQEQSGKLSIFIADQLDVSTVSSLRVKGHKQSVTAAVASEDGTMLFTSGKEGTIVKWDLVTGKEVKRLPKLRPAESDRKGKGRADLTLEGHTDEILALALSSDSKWLASGGRDRVVCIWDAQSGTWLRSFGGHRDAISSLVFRKNSAHLFSASFDRTIRLYDLAAMGLVETLFGHQDQIQHVDALRAETAVSVGGRDRTARFWKVADESQLVFRGGRATAQEILANGMDEDHSEKEKEKQAFVEGSLDCVAMIDDSTFVSGGDSGSVCLWSTAKKKPVFTMSLAHGVEEHPSETEGIILEPRWISALACLRYSDVVASGSSDGFVRLWKVDSKLRSLSSLGAIPVPGVVNSLQVIAPRAFFADASWAKAAHAASGKVRAAHTVKGLGVVAGVGQEPRFGRWLRLRGEGMANRTMVLAMPLVAK